MSISMVEKWEPLLEERIGNNNKPPQELGYVTAIIVVTSFSAERALKSLLAQDKPDQAPKKIHKLLSLYDALDPKTQQQLQIEFMSMPSPWQKYWKGSDVQNVFQIANESFGDWRYAMQSEEVSGGIPKGVIRATVAAFSVCVSRL